MKVSVRLASAVNLDPKIFGKFTCLSRFLNKKQRYTDERSITKNKESEKIL